MTRRSARVIAGELSKGPMCTTGDSPGVASCHRQAGVALAMVVWFLAAMSLLVSGIVFQARVDTRMAQLHVARARAAGDGAIQLMLADLMAGTVARQEDSAAMSASYTLGDRQVRVELVPAAGLIDPTTAPPNVLLALFRQGAGLDEGEAQLLADNVVKLRSGPSVGRPRIQLSAIEDILRVEGISRTMLDATRDLLAIGGGGRRGVGAGLMAATPAVQEVLEAAGFGQGSVGRSARRAGLNRVGDGNFRIDALVQFDKQVLLRRRGGRLGTAGSDGLPWKFSRTEPVRAIEAG